MAQVCPLANRKPHELLDNNAMTCFSVSGCSKEAQLTLQPISREVVDEMLPHRLPRGHDLFVGFTLQQVVQETVRSCDGSKPL